MRQFIVCCAAAALMWPGLAEAAEPSAKEMAQRVADTLRESGELSNYRVGVKYQDGVAWLLGSVTSKEQANTASRLTGKIDRVHANSQGRGRRHERRLASAIVPREKPQERVRTAVEVVARNGTDWLPRLVDEVEAFPTEHVVVHLPPAPPAHAAEGEPA